MDNGFYRKTSILLVDIMMDSVGSTDQFSSGSSYPAAAYFSNAIHLWSGSFLIEIDEITLLVHFNDSLVCNECNDFHGTSAWAQYSHKLSLSTLLYQVEARNFSNNSNPLDFH